jgi:hypothetical protein
MEAMGSVTRARRTPAREVERPAAVPNAGMISFAELWRNVTSDPYELPHHEVTLRSFFAGFSYQLARAGRRIIADQRDLLPRFRKLIRPNAICLAGRWKITQPSPYSGLFCTGAEALLVARASVAFGETESGHYRSFGMAGKLFPTLDPEQPVRTANFFVIDDNGGTKTENYLDAQMTTLPGLSINPSSLRNLPLLIAITVAQRLADTRSETRQLYPLSEIRVADRDLVRTPRFMRVSGKKGQRIAARDFRDQLRTERFKGPIGFDIATRDTKQEPWRTLGSIEFEQDVVSDSGDHRLHFSHPRWKSELR